jgi:hypothetical protein
VDVGDHDQLDLGGFDPGRRELAGERAGHA